MNSVCKQFRHCFRTLSAPSVRTYTDTQMSTGKLSTSLQVLRDDSDFSADELLDKPRDPLGPADPEEISEVTPHMDQSFNFAAYVNRSPTLQKLVDLGVDLSKLERRAGIPQFIVRLDYDQDMAPRIDFLQDTGVLQEELGAFLTRNPLIFKANLDNLRARVEYLKSKKFDSSMIAQVVTRDPYWLMFGVDRIDRRLGHFQKTFQLSGDQLRGLAVAQPRLITYNMFHIKKMTFMIKEEMGFNLDEMKALLMKRPRIWMLGIEPRKNSGQKYLQ